MTLSGDRIAAQPHGNAQIGPGRPYAIAACGVSASNTALTTSSSSSIDSAGMIDSMIKGQSAGT